MWTTSLVTACFPKKNVKSFTAATFQRDKIVTFIFEFVKFAQFQKTWSWKVEYLHWISYLRDCIFKRKTYIGKFLVHYPKSLFYVTHHSDKYYAYFGNWWRYSWTFSTKMNTMWQLSVTLSYVFQWSHFFRVFQNLSHTATKIKLHTEWGWKLCSDSKLGAPTRNTVTSFFKWRIEAENSHIRGNTILLSFRKKLSEN